MKPWMLVLGLAISTCAVTLILLLVEVQTAQRERDAALERAGDARSQGFTECFQRNVQPHLTKDWVVEIPVGITLTIPTGLIEPTPSGERIWVSSKNNGQEGSGGCGTSDDSQALQEVIGYGYVSTREYMVREGMLIETVTGDKIVLQKGLLKRVTFPYNEKKP